MAVGCEVAFKNIVFIFAKVLNVFHFYQIGNFGIIFNNNVFGLDEMPCLDGELNVLANSFLYILFLGVA